MKHLLSLSLIVSLIAISCNTSSQTKIITGKIIDKKNEPIIAGSVLIKNSPTRTTSDINGKFQLEVPDSSATLIVKSPGYISKEVKVNNALTTLEIVLEEETPPLKEIIVNAPLIEADHIATMSSGITYDYHSMGDISSEGAKSATFASYDEESEAGLMRRTDPNAKAGVLTAGEINDFSKWILWKDIETKDLKEWKTFWKVHPEKRYCIQVETENGMPLVDVPVELLNEKQQIFWSARTDNTGKAELWPNIFSNADAGHLNIHVSLNGANYSLNRIKEFHDGINILKIPVACGAPDAVDVAFVVDATGSMQDEINYLKAELDNIIFRIKDSLSNKNLNLGCVFYRDHGDDYLTKKSDLSPDIQTTINFIKENNAGGGGDNPEAVDEALNTAINHLSWRPNATTRMIFLILDAPPHSDSAVKVQLQKLVMQATAKGIRIIPVTCSGIDKSAEYLLRSFALATNGTYIFLTDHSGVGNHHIEPTTDMYDVELLNNILFRVIYNFSHTIECAPASAPEETDTLIVFNPVALFPVDSFRSDQQDSIHVEEHDSSKSNAVKFMQWKYYPNPTFGIVHVEVEGTIKEFFVTDLSGKIILRKEANKNDSFEIDLSNFAAGTYFITAEYSPEKRVSGKVILVH
ncbi:MAG TPA: carboxypeptidase-like regulatory domain-containing protein [Chitinophagales bacterium]|nr:carboxypeptidase-like regulatory domain-containing protein [Chitinophagales bacterium]